MTLSRLLPGTPGGRLSPGDGGQRSALPPSPGSWELGCVSSCPVTGCCPGPQPARGRVSGCWAQKPRDSGRCRSRWTARSPGCGSCCCHLPARWPRAGPLSCLVCSRNPVTLPSTSRALSPRVPFPMASQRHRCCSAGRSPGPPTPARGQGHREGQLWSPGRAVPASLPPAPPWEPAEQGLGIKAINKADVASVFLTALPAR